MLCVLPREELKEEHVARDALELEAEVLHLQLGHRGMDENSKLPQPAGPGGRVSQALPQHQGSPDWRRGEGVVCP